MIHVDKVCVCKKMREEKKNSTDTPTPSFSFSLVPLDYWGGGYSLDSIDEEPGNGPRELEDSRALVHRMRGLVLSMWMYCSEWLRV